ncbi:hypothetical protein BCY88_08655 [Paraburkholderia fungorum]|uniref:Chromate transporter n=1 Tax=Paraburkholderia fungorum TaxID=134537 RepID=A0A420FS84_9BURK|nr:hypothetical protein BCY88_08655 [Paraburkholderia fungorum]
MSANEIETVAHERAWTVFLVFLRLGLTSFGGPIAHLGYFRTEFVTRRRWLSERSYADLVALCQFLPGPASSQVGVALGLSRAGFPGALAAWAGFTLPSAIALIMFAFGMSRWGSAFPVDRIKSVTVAPIELALRAVAAYRQSPSLMEQRSAGREIKVSLPWIRTRKRRLSAKSRLQAEVEQQKSVG